MAEDISEKKLAYAKVLYKKGVTAPAKIQQAVKKKFGTGMNFRDLGKINPSGKKKRKAAKRGPGRPRKTAGKPGRPKGWSNDQWLLLVDGGAEVFGGKRKLEARVAGLVAEGYAATDLTVYEKSSMKMTLKTTVTL